MGTSGVSVIMRGSSIACALLAGGVVAGCGGSSDSGRTIEVSTFPLFGERAPVEATYTYSGADVDATGDVAVWRLPSGAPIDRAKLDVIGDVLDIGSPQISVASNGAAEWFASTSSGGFVCEAFDVEAGAVPETTVAIGDVVKVAAGEPAACGGQVDDGSGLSEDEIMARALELFAQLGISTEDAVVETPDRWTVSVARLLDGAASPLTSVISFTPDGEIAYASGFLAEPERVEGYERGTIADSLAWLEAGWLQYGWNALGEPRSAGGDGDGPVEIVAGGPRGDLGGVWMACAPNAKECFAGGAGAPVPAGDIAFTAADAGLLRVDSPDGTVWIVPAWTLHDAANGDYSVPALDPNTFEPVAAEGFDDRFFGPGVAVAPVPVGEPAVVVATTAAPATTAGG